MYKIKRIYVVFVFVFAFCLLTSACGLQDVLDFFGEQTYSLDSIPAFSDEPYVELHDNVPDFSEEEKTTDVFEKYSELDDLGRCGQAYANICQELMPTEKRGEIGMVKPSGWQTIKYDIVEGNYLYNRCHLIGFQLAGENANEKNLITGTRYMNVDGMLPFENEVAEYVKETNHHVLYRVTPVYDGNNLLATGVEMEAWSVEDDGSGICFDVFVYNSQPGITIDYATGASQLSKDGVDKQAAAKDDKKGKTYVLNTSTHKFHKKDCDNVSEIKARNKKTYKGSREDLVEQGYSPCGICKP